MANFEVAKKESAETASKIREEVERLLERNDELTSQDIIDHLSYAGCGDSDVANMYGLWCSGCTVFNLEKTYDIYREVIYDRFQEDLDRKETYEDLKDFGEAIEDEAFLGKLAEWFVDFIDDFDSINDFDFSCDWAFNDYCGFLF